MNLSTPAGRRKAFLMLAGLAVVVFTFGVVLPRIADYGDVWEAVGRVDLVWILALAAATVLNVVTFAPPWMLVLPGLTLRQALPFTQASTAFTYIAPGGGIVGMAGSFALLRNWGFPPSDIARAVTLTGIWNQLSNLLLPIVAVFLLAAEEEQDAVLTTAAFVGSAVFGVAVVLLVLVLWSDAVAEAVGDLAARVVDRVLRVVRRGPVSWSGTELASFRRATVELLRERWWMLTIAAVAGNLAVFLVLLLSMRALSVTADDLTWVELFAGWSLARMLQLVPITPGGLGAVEVGLTSILVGFGGANAPVVAGVLVYRVLTIVPTLLLGLATILVWRRLRPEHGNNDGLEGLPPEAGKRRSE